MAIKMSDTVRNAMMNAYESAIGASALLRIYTGAPPATLATAPSGTLLVEIPLPADWMAAAAAGVISKAGTWSANAVAGGLAGYYRILNAAGSATHEQGTVAVSGGDMTINNTNIATGQTITVSAFTKTAGNA